MGSSPAGVRVMVDKGAGETPQGCGSPQEFSHHTIRPNTAPREGGGGGDQVLSNYSPLRRSLDRRSEHTRKSPGKHPMGIL